jgi:hypothetical protein
MGPLKLYPGAGKTGQLPEFFSIVHKALSSITRNKKQKTFHLFLQRQGGGNQDQTVHF